MPNEVNISAARGPTNDEILTAILVAEGGLENDPDDPGGITNFGITIKSLTEFYGHEAFARDIQLLTPAMARVVYEELYIKRPGFDQIWDATLRELLVDCGVNNGRERTIKWLQRAVGVVEDGKLGARTLQGVNGHGLSKVFYSVLAQRYECYAALPVTNPKLIKYLRGWIRRANRFLGGM